MAYRIYYNIGVSNGAGNAGGRRVTETGKPRGNGKPSKLRKRKTIGDFKLS